MRLSLLGNVIELFERCLFFLPVFSPMLTKSNGFLAMVSFVWLRRWIGPEPKICCLSLTSVSFTSEDKLRPRVSRLSENSMAALRRALSPPLIGESLLVAIFWKVMRACRASLSCGVRNLLLSVWRSSDAALLGESLW